MSKNIVCSLTVKNKTAIVRQIGTGILGPNHSGLFHFKSLNQIKHALELEKKNQIAILSPIPSFVMVQLQGGEESFPESTLVVEPISPIQEQPVQEEQSKPDFYLTWEEVEGKDKKELQEWFEANPAEGLSLPKSKNAAATKEIVHAFLAGQFEDHVSPVEETPVEIEEPTSEE